MYSTPTGYITSSHPASNNYTTSDSTPPAWNSVRSSNNTVPFWDDITAPSARTGDSASTTIPLWGNDRNSSTVSWTNSGNDVTNPLWRPNTDNLSIWKDVASESGNITLKDIARLVWAITNNHDNITNNTIGNFLVEWNNSSFATNLTVNTNETVNSSYTNVAEIGTLTPLAALFRFVSCGVIITVNVLTIVTFCRTRALRTLSNMLTVNLAVADLLVGLLVFLSAMTAVYIPDFDTAAAECVFRLCWFFVSCSVSMVTICLQGGERYLFIVHPYRHVDFVNAKVLGGLIALSWAIGLSFGMTPYLFEYHYTAALGCDIYYVLSPNHVVYASNGIFLGTSLPTLVFYSLIARLVVEKRRSVVVVPTPNYSNVSSTSASSLSGGNPNSRHVSLCSKLLALKAPAVVFGVFFCCWAPHMFGYLFHAGGILIPRIARVWCTNLGLFNSAMNFFVYLSLNRQFREALSFRVAWRCPRAKTNRQVSLGRQSKKAKGRVSLSPACFYAGHQITANRTLEVVATSNSPYIVPVPDPKVHEDRTADNAAAFY